MAVASLNADMGESFGIHVFGNDEALAKLVDTANVACGFHSGDPTAIRKTVQTVLAAGATVGAHPGLPDLVGFGRREMKLFPDETEDIVRYQVGALVAFVKAEGGQLDHIKPHGSLYGMTARDAALALAVARVAADYDVPVFGMAGTEHERAAHTTGTEFVSEFYVDLDYSADGSLIITRQPHTTAPDEARKRALRAITTGTALAATGEELTVRADSICVHSDTPNATAVAAAVREALSATAA